MKRKNLLFLAVVGIMYFAPFGAEAEEIMTAGQVVISATRTEMLLEDAPQTIEVIGSEEIKRTGANSVKEVLEKAFGTDMHYGGGEPFTLRGLNSDYVLVLLNGRKVAVPTGQSAVSYLNINMASIERIEVLRGQASALYGADAIGGVINIITKKSKKREFTIGATYDPEEITNYYQLDFGTMGAWDAIVNARYTKYQAQRTDYQYTYDGWSGSDKGYGINLNADVGYKFNANHELRLYSDIYESETENEYDTYDTGTTSKRRNGSQRLSSVLTYNGNVGDHMYSVSGNYSWDKQRGYEGTDSRPDDTYEMYGFDVRDTWALNEYNTLTFGGEFQRSTMKGKELVPSNASVDYFALFIQDEIMLFDETLFILPAVRYDHYSTFSGEFSPGIGVTWEFYKDQRLKANYGLGFKAPTMVQLWGDDSGYISNKGNPDLKTESSVAWDIGYEGRYKNVSGSITYHSTEIKDMIGRGDKIIGGYYDGWYNRANIGRVKINGVEAELAIDFLKYFTAKGQYAYLDAKNLETNELIGDRAKHTYQLEFIFDRPDWGLYTSIWSRWIRDLYDSDLKDTIDFNTVHFSMSKVFKEKYSVFFNINNIFNSTNERTGDGQQVRDRNWQVGFEVKF